MDSEKISIQISVTSGNNLRHVLQSIKNQNYSNCEIIIINSGSNRSVSKLSKEFSAVEIKEKCNLLRSRYLGHKYCTGKYELILDETRFISLGTLAAIANSANNMLILPEIQIGKGFINHLDSIDKKLLNVSGYQKDPTLSLLIPRVYKRDILDKAFTFLKSRLSEEVFNSIVAKDDRLIFYSAQVISHSYPQKSMTGKIYHLADTNLLKEIKKYARYGKTSRFLRHTEFRYMTRLFDKRRGEIESLKDFRVFLLYALRGVSFLYGYYFLSHSTVHET